MYRCNTNLYQSNMKLFLYYLVLFSYHLTPNDTKMIPNNTMTPNDTRIISNDMNWMIWKWCQMIQEWLCIIFIQGGITFIQSRIIQFISRKWYKTTTMLAYDVKVHVGYHVSGVWIVVYKPFLCVFWVPSFFLSY